MSETTETEAAQITRAFLNCGTCGGRGVVTMHLHGETASVIVGCPECRDRLSVLYPAAMHGAIDVKLTLQPDAEVLRLRSEVQRLREERELAIALADAVFDSNMTRRYPAHVLTKAIVVRNAFALASRATPQDTTDARTALSADRVSEQES